MTADGGSNERSHEEALRCLRIIETLDEEIERCRRLRLPLAQAMGRLLPAACGLLQADGAIVRALDERLEWRTFPWGTIPESALALVPDTLPDEPAPTETSSLPDDGVLIVRLLDCADEVVGVSAFHFAKDSRETAVLEREVAAAAEQIDNYLEGVAAAARKHRIAVSASQALRRAILDEGADEAIRTLSAELDLREVVLLYGSRAERAKGHINYRCYTMGHPIADSSKNPSEALEAVLRGEPEILRPDNHALKSFMGGDGAGTIETHLVNGLNQEPIGKLCVLSTQHGLDPEGVDILHIFAECLSQRLVDYSREWRILATTFSPHDVNRLLRETQYHTRFLSPRVEPIAVLFSDVVSFTAICEQVLNDAREVGELIDRWSAGVVEIIFRNHGVFDKLVGDCAIGLFGPPFFEASLAENSARAVRTAVEINRFTRRLGEESGLDERIRAKGVKPGLAAATGVNAGPTSVGFFGPNDDYTGFSSAMNNASRLQGVAGYDEVLISQDVKDLVEGALGDLDVRMEGPERAKVKNVAEPLVYYRLVRAT